MTRIRQLTGAKVAEIMARLLEGPGLPIQPGTCAACLRVRLAPHRGVPTPSRAHELGYAFEIAYDERLPQPKIDAVIAAELACYIVGACRGDVTDEDLIADVCVTMFAVRLPIRVPVVEPIELPACVPESASVPTLALNALMVKSLLRRPRVRSITITNYGAATTIDTAADFDLIAEMTKPSGERHRTVFIMCKRGSGLEALRNWLVHFR